MEGGTSSGGARGRRAMSITLSVVGLLAATAAIDSFGRWYSARARVLPPAPPPRPENPARPPDYMLDPQAGARHVEELVRRSDGDWNRLTELEQRWLNGVTAGRGEQLLRMRARELRARSRAGHKNRADDAPRRTSTQ